MKVIIDERPQDGMYSCYIRIIYNGWFENLLFNLGFIGTKSLKIISPTGVREWEPGRGQWQRVN